MIKRFLELLPLAFIFFLKALIIDRIINLLLEPLNLLQLEERADLNFHISHLAFQLYSESLQVTDSCLEGLNFFIQAFLDGMHAGFNMLQHGYELLTF
jgi:hypothetical protein